jgi:hypothetical protein
MAFPGLRVIGDGGKLRCGHVVGGCPAESSNATLQRQRPTLPVSPAVFGTQTLRRARRRSARAWPAGRAP